MTRIPHNKGRTNVEIYGAERAAEMKKARQEFTKGNKNALGHIKSEESNEQNRQKHLGKPGGNRGNPSNYHHPPETIEVIREASKNRTYPDRIRSVESNKKTSDTLKGISHLELLGSQELVDQRVEKFRESFRATWEEKWRDNPPESRETTQYYEWQEAVRNRDKYTCQHCGIKQEELPQDATLADRYLHAHHIKSWLEFKDLRYVVDNGLTLCPSCHRKEETRLAILRNQVA